MSSPSIALNKNLIPVDDHRQVATLSPSRAPDKIVSCLQPLEDPRWDRFVASHPNSSAFHASPWLKALQLTYGYKPVAYTTSATGAELENAIVFCEVDSWLTGKRLVSLPFSDHCDALASDDDTRAIMSRVLDRDLASKGWRYVEMRPLQIQNVSTLLHCRRVAYAFHRLDLRPTIDILLRNLHQNSTRRKILRASREGLKYQEGTSEELLNHFYELFCRMRLRHKVPPPPREWFANLIRCFGDSLRIRVAFAEDRAVAAMITIAFKETMMYKYGCSDTRFNRLGGMHLLYWRAIHDAKMYGLEWFDFGRTDAGQQGLITFKNRWGADESVLTYFRYGQAANSAHIFDLPIGRWKTRTMKSILSWLPGSVVSKAGELLYRHIG